MTFTDFVCLFGKEGLRPAREHKKLWAGANAPARSPLIKTLS